MLETRREFLKGSALALPVLASARRQYPASLASTDLVLSPYSLARFVDRLPIPPLAKPVRSAVSPDGTGAQIPYYRIVMREFQAKVHRDVQPTTFWGYEGTSPGPTFETHCGQAVIVQWVNELPHRHFLPIDHTLHGAEADKPDVRTVVHLHGGRVPPESDGYPENWFTPGESAACHYLNNQEAAGLFYHDHAMGITRLNALAGLFGLFFLRDEVEASLNLPGGRYEVPLVLYDRLFQLDGRLYYPTSGNPAAPWTSEFYGNALLVNGKLFPFLEVEPRRYRFRLLNASNAGFFQLTLSREDRNLVPGTEPFAQIGSDQGLLPAPVPLKSLLITPGERADLVIDFAAHRGKTLYLKHGTSAILQFRVCSGRLDDTSALPSSLRPIARIPEAAALRTRDLTLVDFKNEWGKASLMLLNSAHWSMPVTENPALDSTEIWNFINLTDDTHPIHLHLVRFQILDRRRFDFSVYQKTGELVYTGPPIPPEPNEMGWKDTVRADVLMATRIIVRFEDFTGRYVWHCHVLEHEDNEMMRPYEIVRPG